jgi:hypothetical protein
MANVRNVSDVATSTHAGTAAPRLGAVSGLLTAAAGLTGLSVQIGLVDTSRVRWVHHALFGVSLASTAAACIASTRRPARSAGGASRVRRLSADGLAPAVAAMLALTRTSGGTRNHAIVASIALGSHAVAARCRTADARCVDASRHG